MSVLKISSFYFLMELAKIPSNTVFQIPAMAEPPEGGASLWRGSWAGHQVRIGSMAYSRFTFPRLPELQGNHPWVALPSSDESMPGANMWFPTTVYLSDITVAFGFCAFSVLLMDPWFRGRSLPLKLITGKYLDC